MLTPQKLKMALASDLHELAIDYLDLEPQSIFESSVPLDAILCQRNGNIIQRSLKAYSNARSEISGRPDLQDLAKKSVTVGGKTVWLLYMAQSIDAVEAKAREV